MVKNVCKPLSTYLCVLLICVFPCLLSQFVVEEFVWPAQIPALSPMQHLWGELELARPDPRQIPAAGSTSGGKEAVTAAH